MRFAASAFALGLACAPLYAQIGMEGKPAERGKPAHKSAAKPEPKRSSMPDRVRPPSQQDVTRPQDQRAREPQRTQPSAIKPDRTRRSDVYRQEKSAPSPAQQFQQEQFERQQVERERIQPQRGQPQRVQPQQKTVQQDRGVRCSAYPACTRPPGSCQGVVRTYASSAGAREDMVQRCVQANTPDSCNCAAQCARVAQCSKF